jgi:hypothetical protein
MEKYIPYDNISQKKSAIAILILNKSDFRRRKFTRNKEIHNVKHG